MLRRHEQSSVTTYEPNRSLLLPDFSRLADFPANGTNLNLGNGNAVASSGIPPESNLSYENTDIQEITRRQLREDIMAYRYDLDFCRSLIATDVTPQEARALQLRTLDLGHQIRSAQHRVELIEAHQRRAQMSSSSSYHHNGHSTTYRGSHGSPMSGQKRQRIAKRSHSEDDVENDHDTSMGCATTVDGTIDSFTPVNGSNGAASTAAYSQASNAVQRLGFWKCRLCTASKYLNAGLSRVPSEPSKWPLKDVSKMLNHFLDLHTEHTPAERCQELGAALNQNRGPFEYWLTQTRKQELDDASTIDTYVSTLQGGALPDGLRRLNRAAGLFPNIMQDKKHT